MNSWVFKTKQTRTSSFFYSSKFWLYLEPLMSQPEASHQRKKNVFPIMKYNLTSNQRNADQDQNKISYYTQYFDKN